MSQSDICFSIDKFDALTDGNMEIAGLLEKDVSKVVTPEEFVTPDEAVTSEEVPSSIQVFNSCVVDKIKNPGTHKAYERD